MPSPWCLPEVNFWESVWARGPGLFRWPLPLPSPCCPSSTPVCTAPSSLIQALWLWSWPPVKDDADFTLRTSLPCCCLQGPKLCWFTPQGIIFSLYLLVVLFSFRHLLTWELEIKSPFYKDEKVVSHFLPAHMKGPPNRALGRCWKFQFSGPWIHPSWTAHRCFSLYIQQSGCLDQAAVLSKGLEAAQGE